MPCAEFRLLITGASRGLGRALSLRFASLGYRLILTARTEGALGELSDEIVSAGNLRPSLVVMDLRNFEQIDSLGATIFERFSSLDGVILNAAYLGVLSPLAHGDIDLWQDLFAVNVLANHRLLCCLHGLLLRSNNEPKGTCGGTRGDSGGGIVVGVTCKDYRGSAFWGGYGASKAAFETMLSSYAQENLSPAVSSNSSTASSSSLSSGLRVLCLDPGKMSSALRSCAFPGEARDKYPITERTLAPFIDAFSKRVVNN